MSELSENREQLDRLRSEVIERLTDSFARDALSETDFEERLSRATGATTRNELVVLVDDLPTPAAPRSGSSGSASPAVLVNRGRVKDDGAVVAILGGGTRKGLWRPPRRLTAVAVLGGVDLDFTAAELPPEGTELFVIALLGGVDITVPEGLNVDCTGIPLLGGFDDASGGMKSDHPPILRVRGVVALGGVSVHTRTAHRRLPPH